MNTGDKDFENPDEKEDSNLIIIAVITRPNINVRSQNSKQLLFT